MKRQRILSLAIATFLCCSTLTVPVSARQKSDNQSHSSSATADTKVRPNGAARSDVLKILYPNNDLTSPPQINNEGADNSSPYDINSSNPAGQLSAPKVSKPSKDINITNRFIVKYKSQANQDVIKNKINGKFKSVKSISEGFANNKFSNADGKKDNTSNIATSASSANHGANAAANMITAVLNPDSDYGKTQNVSVSESSADDISAVNLDAIQVDSDITLQDFETKINNLGLSDQIEYIQPDYTLSMDSFSGLTLELTDESPDDFNVTPGVSNGDNPSESTIVTNGGNDSDGSSFADTSSDNSAADAPSHDADNNAPNVGDAANTDANSNGAANDIVTDSSGLDTQDQDGDAIIQEQDKLTQDESGLTSEDLIELLKSTVDIDAEADTGGVNSGVSSTIVAVIDTGMDISHPALAYFIWNNRGETFDGIDDDQNGFVDDVNGWDFTTNTNQVYSSDNPPEYAHGTHIAGIIAQTAAETSTDIKIMPLKVFRACLKSFKYDRQKG